MVYVRGWNISYNKEYIFKKVTENVSADTQESFNSMWDFDDLDFKIEDPDDPHMVYVDDLDKQSPPLLR